MHCLLFARFLKLFCYILYDFLKGLFLCVSLDLQFSFFPQRENFKIPFCCGQNRDREIREGGGGNEIDE